MSNPSLLRFRFESDALASNAFEVLRCEGTEEISRPYRFDIQLVASDPAIDLHEVIGAAAHLSLPGAQHGERTVHGVVASAVQGAQLGPQRFEYRATLVPRMWMLSQNRRSRIYQAKTIPDIVLEQLRGLADTLPRAAADAGDMVALRLHGSYPVSEYRVQYDETDLDFMSRLLEFEGISYFFEQGAHGERLVITDHNGGFGRCVDESGVRYAPEATGAAVVGSLQCEQRSLPRKLVLHDHNDQLPHVPLQAEADVDAGGVGLVTDHGSRFATPEDGERLSIVRAQELRCRQQTFVGTGNRGEFCAGHSYRLAAHFRDDFNQDYLITRIRHIVESDGDVAVYRNEFDSVPLATTWRPLRSTPKPRLHGIMHAHVDGSGPGERAQMDDQGRYKLSMPFDLDGAREGQGSCFIRMAQPFGGKDQGMHFPLAKGTEVIWTCIDGDPDRPIITSTVPNPAQRSVVTSDNADRNVLRTAGGITMEFGNGNAVMSSSDAVTPRVPASADDFDYTAAARTASTELRQQRQLQPDDDGFDQAEENTSGAKWFKLYVPDHNGMSEAAGQIADQGDRRVSTYLRLGSFDPQSPIENAWHYTPGQDGARLHLNAHAHNYTALTGVFDYTEWNRTTITMHNNEQYVHGRNRINIGGGGLGLWDAGFAYKNYFRQTGNVGDTKFYRHTTMDHGSSDSYSFGDSESFFGGFTFDGSGGLSTSINIGGSLSVGASMDVELGYGFSVNAKLGSNVDLIAEAQNTMDAKNHDILCDKSVSIRTKGPVEKGADKVGSEAVKKTWKLYTAAGAVVIGGIAAGTAGVVMPWLLSGDTEDEGATWASRIGLPLATAAWAAALIYGKVKNKAVDSNAPMAPSSFDLDEFSINLAVGMPPGGISVPTTSSSIEITALGIKLACGGPTGSSLELTPTGVTLKCGAASKVMLTPASFMAKSALCTLDGTSSSIVKAPNVLLKGKGNLMV